MVAVVSGARIKRDTLTASLETLDDTHREVIKDIMEYWGVKGVSEMKSGARWTDRTGNARQGLRFRVTQAGDQTTLVYFGSMPYSIWLEIRWSGKYAIIGPVISTVIPRLKEMFESVFD